MTEKDSAKQTDEADDRLLLNSVADGDRAAFGTLFAAYYPRLFKFIFRLTNSYATSEELVNDVMLTVWESASRFRGDSRVSTWIFGIAYRQSLRRLRRRRFLFVPLKDGDMPTVNMGDAVEREDWVRQGIRRLPPKQQLTVLLVYYVGLSCEETARVTDSPVSTVKTRMFHARRKLNSYLSPSGGAMAEDTENG